MFFLPFCHLLNIFVHKCPTLWNSCSLMQHVVVWKISLKKRRRKKSWHSHLHHDSLVEGTGPNFRVWIDA